jgi:hypothetical protein
MPSVRFVPTTSSGDNVLKSAEEREAERREREAPRSLNPPPEISPRQSRSRRIRRSLGMSSLSAA